jgi:hypothetical protein
MLRSIAGVVVGYIAIALFIMIWFFSMYAIMGTDRAYKPGEWEASLAWVVGALLAGVLGALLGGLVCRWISGGRRKAVIALAIVVGALGLATAGIQLTAAPPADARPDEVDFADAASKSVSPLWATIANPVIGVVGVLIGGGALRGKPTAPVGSDGETAR